LDIEGDSLDEVLIDAYRQIQKLGVPNKGSRGDHRELIGVCIRIRHPRARLSRSNDRGVPSAVGEFLWYMSGTDDIDFITAYIPNYQKEVGPSGRINGAYGPRLFSSFDVDQIEAVTDLLRRKPSTRRAVIQIYGARDLLTDEEVPCTTTLQFFVREGRLHLMASLRSNDAYLGLPHDVFCFTMLQEMMANRLGLELGEYVQMVGSFHLYDKHDARTERYMDEGHHRLAEMPPMPAGDPFRMVPEVLRVEAMIRRGDDAATAAIAALPDFWADVLRLAQAKLAKTASELDVIRGQLKNTDYEAYIDDRKDALERQAARDAQRRREAGA
jgi:thymidylate synthase